MTRLSWRTLTYDTVQINDGIERIEWPGLPLGDLLDHGVGDLGDQVRGDIGIVHLLEAGGDLPGSHALGIQAMDLVIHGRESYLVLFNQLRLKGAISVSGDLNQKRPVFGDQVEELMISRYTI